MTRLYRCRAVAAHQLGTDKERLYGGAGGEEHQRPVFVFLPSRAKWNGCMDGGREDNASSQYRLIGKDCSELSILIMIVN